MDYKNAKHVWVSKKIHDILLVEKKKEGGKNIPIIAEELILLGVEYKKKIEKNRTKR